MDEHRGFVRIIVIVLLVLVVIGGFLFTRREKIISGYVLDCRTDNPIANVEVSANQRGWGRSNGSVVWDKTFITSTVSNESGYFSITYKIGSSAHITAEKDGYIVAEQWEDSQESITIKLLEGNKSTERTYYCKLSTECLSCNLESGNQVCRNICTQYE